MGDYPLASRSASVRYVDGVVVRAIALLKTQQLADCDNTCCARSRPATEREAFLHDQPGRPSRTVEVRGGDASQPLAKRPVPQLISEPEYGGDVKRLRDLVAMHQT
jgi:hypothetical protein